MYPHGFLAESPDAHAIHIDVEDCRQIADHFLNVTVLHRL